MLAPTRAFRGLHAAFVAGLLCACAGRGGPPSSAPPSEPTPASQPRTAPPDSAEIARALLTRSLEALGGAEAVARLRGFEIQLSTRPARGNWAQARDWSDSTPNPIPGQFRYLVDLEHRRVMYEFNTVSPGNIRFNYLTRFDTAGGWQVDLLGWRLGTDILRNPAAAVQASLSAAMRLLPQVAVRQALRADQPPRPVASSGGATDAVAYVDPATGQVVTIEIERGSGLPTRTTVGNSSVEFHDYRVQDGFRVPYRRIQRAGEQVTAEQTVVRLDLAPSLSDDRFEMPAGYSDPPVRGTPRATRVASGVYRLDEMPNGYHSAFAVWENGVAVLEAPLSAAYAEAALRVIADTAPGKRVTHVFVTHHHSDHVGGLAPYVSQGATIVVGAGLEEAIRRQLPDSLRERATFIPVSGRQTFGRGRGRIETIPVPNSHANGNVAFFLPAHGILFQGDLFYIPERGDVPAAFETSEALAAVVRAQRLRVNQVIGVHGRTGTWAEVEQSLRRR